MLLPPSIEKGHVISNEVAVPTIGTTCANLQNQSTINKMKSYPYNFGKVTMESMNTLCHGLGGIGNDCKRSACFL
jgi:hypothetical protein